MDVLEIIRAKRKSLGITQEHMARLLCIPRSTYNGIETNVIQLKIYDFFRIVKILDIPLETFQDEKYIVITQDDLNDLLKSVERINTIAQKITNNISTRKEQEHISFNLNELKGASKVKKCAICGVSSGFYPLCKHHLELKEKGLVYKNEFGYWVLKE